MLRSRVPFLPLVALALAACDLAEPPSGHVADSPSSLVKNAESFTRSSYTFENQTGAEARKLVIEFNAQPAEVQPFSSGMEVSGSTLTVSGIFSPLARFSVMVTVSSRSIRIKKWYWAAEDGTVLGTINKGCNAKKGCHETGPGPAGFQIVSPLQEIPPFSSIAYCFYFRTPNLVETAIRQWRSRLGPGVVRMNVILTETDAGSPGSSSAVNCQIGLSSFNHHWAYTAYEPESEFSFPSDDGTGSPVGLVIPPNHSGYLFIQYDNMTPSPIASQVSVEALAYDSGTEVTPANSFVAYNQNISIPPGATDDMETQSCSVPEGAKFFWMSTYSHQQSIRTSIRDGATTVFESTDFANPGASKWSAPFFTFASGQLTYEFVYANTGANATRTVTAGNSYSTDEVAAALTYFFPASAPRFCLGTITF